MLAESCKASFGTGGSSSQKARQTLFCRMLPITRDGSGRKLPTRRSPQGRPAQDLYAKSLTKRTLMSLTPSHGGLASVVLRTDEDLVEIKL